MFLSFLFFSWKVGANWAGGSCNRDCDCGVDGDRTAGRYLYVRERGNKQKRRKKRRRRATGSEKRKIPLSRTTLTCGSDDDDTLLLEVLHTKPSLFVPGSQLTPSY